MTDDGATALRPRGAELGQYLGNWAAGDAQRTAVAATVESLSRAAARIAILVADGPLAAGSGAVDADGGTPGTPDVQASDAIREAAQAAPVAYYTAEQESAIVTLRAGAPLALAAEPLDGSSNVDVDGCLGTLFSLFPASPRGATASFLRPAREQIAAGYVVYGPHTALVLTVGSGVDLFVLDRARGQWRLARRALRIPVSTSEFAINASNYRHWHGPVRAFIDDCLEGAEGPRGKNFNMLWVASLVAETHRIFARGGVFLYPADRRPGHGRGRLRLLFQAAPIAMLAEQAGGGATDGVERILDRAPDALDDRTPLVFGSAEKVARIVAYHVNPAFVRDVSPLFQERGLFRY